MCKTVKSKMKYLVLAMLCCVLASCRTHEKVVYLQDAANMTTINIPNYQGIKIQPKDIISIVVSSKTPELAMSFNLPLHSYQAGSSTTSSSYSQRLLGYLVSSDGKIDFPGLGELTVIGMTRDQLSEMIKQKLINEGLILDPIVNTEFMNFKIAVLGEVRTPSAFYIQDDKFTIFDAIGRAGDLTIYGRRDNVVVQREQNGVITYHRVDLRSTDIIRSPVFYLQQNDIVYVTPNNTVIARSRINENRTLGVGISLASFFANIVNIYYTISLKKP